MLDYKTIIIKHYALNLSGTLIGCPCEIKECLDSGTREYLPNGITEVLSSTAFIRDGLNVCILYSGSVVKTKI